MVGALAAELLRRHVRGRPQERARLGHGHREERLRVTGLVAALRLEGPREAEVADPRAPVGPDEDIVRLEVAVHEPGGVRGGEASTGLRQHLQHLGKLAGPRGEPISERAAVDELHRNEDLIVVRARVVRRDDVGVREPRDGLGLTEDAALRRARGLLDANELQRHPPVELGVARGIDGAHRALAELLLDDVAPDRLHLRKRP